ncbi:ribonuclease H-like domain-containing protein [Abortiporus biennis]|nr:ribonuclease H-like domain-containing protein [Abortiporus biennis]
MNTDQYILCDQGAVLVGALAEMRDAPFIILDCEGQKLGSQTGILSIIGCRARGKSYLIDILAFTGKIKHQPLLQQLFRLLSSPKPLKIMFDGRKDFSEFYHGHGVHLRGVLDLQVADLSSRSLRGEDVKDQFRRLGTYAIKSDLDRNRNLYMQVHKLNGLFGCLEEFGIEFDEGAKVDHGQWLVRPLSSEYLTYSGKDLLAIEKLFAHLKGQGFINTAELERSSQQYIEMWISGQPNDRTGHGFLPLDLLYKSAMDEPALFALCVK